MSTQVIKTSGGIGLPTLLTVLFVGLKITGYIDWSWWWVVSPLWIGFVAVIAFFIIAIIFLLIVGLIVSLLDN